MRAEIVPPEVLLPPEAHGRGFQPRDAALVIDGYLRRLAGQEARCRAVLGRLARAFLRRRGQQVLGFARLGDYTRERLGLSARELQSLAAVAERLEALPAICAAFEDGGLSWAQVRLVAGVASAETERTWLELARGRTVRALAAMIRAAGRTDLHEDEDGDAEPRVRFRLRCPRRVARLWQETVELARRMAGAQLTQGQAAEAIAAEGLSARPPSAETWPEPPPVSPTPANGDETHAAFAPDLDWNAVREAIPAEVLVLAIGCEDLDPFALDARMRAVVDARHRIDWQTGRLLRVFLDRRLYRLMGFSSAGRYLTERLGSSARKARALVALERKTWQAPAFGEAYRAGDLSWVRALTVSPIVTEDTAAAWVGRAQEVTVRRLNDEVEWALAGRDGLAPVAPPPAGATLDEWQTCARPEWELTDSEITFTAPASVVSLFRTAILAFTDRTEWYWIGCERFLCHVRDEWRAQPRHRDPIFERDGWRCAVPACSSRRNLHDHHVLFRSRGGDNARDNRITVCAAHHLHGIHAGRIRAWGTAPDGVTWELGVRPGHAPLLRCAGDRYVVAR